MDENLGKIQRYQVEASSLEPTREERTQLIEKVIDYTQSFLDNNSSIPAYRSFKQEHLDPLAKPFSEEQTNIEDLIPELSKSLDYTGINPASGNHLGYIPGGGVFVSSLADYWVDITNRYAGVFFANPGAVKIENEIIRWMTELAGYPQSAWGCLLSGGSNANLAGIVTARETLLKSLDQYPRAVIYLTSQTHHCVNKALKIAGLHFAQVKYIEVDERYRMQIPALKKQVNQDLKDGLIPFMVVGSVGTTDTGAIDPVNEIADICKEHNIWFHIDAAYGGFFLLTDLLDEHREGISRADSIVMDPHKSLFLPYGLGILLARDGKNLKETFSLTANYLQDVFEMDDEPSPADVSPELTKHFRGFRMWLPLKIHGIKPFRAALYEKRLLAIYFREQVMKITGFEVGPEPDISVVLFRYTETADTNQFNKALMDKIYEDGTIFVSSTTIEGVFWIRVAVLVFRTHKETIDLFLNLLEKFSVELKKLETVAANE